MTLEWAIILMMGVGLLWCCCFTTKPCTFCVGDTVFQEVQITIMGVVDDGCSPGDCDDMNGTFILEDNPTTNCFNSSEETIKILQKFLKLL